MEEKGQHQSFGGGKGNSSGSWQGGGNSGGGASNWLWETLYAEQDKRMKLEATVQKREEEERQQAASASLGAASRAGGP